MVKMKVDPYEVKGDLNYDRIITEFGIKKIDEKLLKRIGSVI